MRVGLQSHIGTPTGRHVSRPGGERPACVRDALPELLRLAKGGRSAEDAGRVREEAPARDAELLPREARAAKASPLVLHVLLARNPLAGRFDDEACEGGNGPLLLRLG